ncbi:MAG: exonuclease SbcCD subunit D [Clostridia bacterium]|nr:exonuclease SbcCD subunit D [Clostridia bacterium]
MKLIHISDLHLGKRIGEFRLISEQSALLDWILRTAAELEADGILLAGDIYDRSVPPVEAVTLFDSFLTRLAERKIPLFAISGNHDSPERISYGSSLFDEKGIHFSAAYDGTVRRVLLEKEGERAYIHLLPFLRPVHVREALGMQEEADGKGSAVAESDTIPESHSMTYTEAMAEVLSRMVLPPDGINILLCHQFLTGSARSESEEIPLAGTLDAVDASLFSAFDYVALGHLHRAQQVTDTIRYSGAPMPYAFSETDQKGCILVDTEDGIRCTFLPVPEGVTRTLAVLTGNYDTLMCRDFRESCPHREDYLKIVLEEDTPVPDAMAKLSMVYPRVVQLSYSSHANPEQTMGTEPLQEGELLSPEQVFASFYTRQNEKTLSEEDLEYIRSLLAKAEGEELCGR